MTIAAERPATAPAADDELAYSIDPYDARTTSENFDLDGWLRTFNPELLATAEGRRIATAYDPLLFAIIYLGKHLKDTQGKITFADAHFLWIRLARRWIGPSRGPKEDRRALVAPRACGKALALDTPILTVDRGWVDHGDLKSGDRVFDERGEPCNVVAVSETWQDRRVFELEFSDGSTIVADENHEWVLRDKWSNHPQSTVDTKTIAERWELPTKRDIKETRYTMDIAGPLAFPERELPIAPYALGAWLGDGHSAGARITVGRDDLEVMKANLTASGETFTVNKVAKNYVLNLLRRNERACLRGHVYAERRTDGRHHCRVCIADFQRTHQGTKSTMDPVVNGTFVRRLRDLDLLNNKHIPEIYLTASIEQRMELLRGLMDTDGTIDVNGRAEFSVCNERLAFDTAALIRSLGIKTVMRIGDAKLNGRVVSKRWRLGFSTGLPIFSMPRKLERVRAVAKRAGTLRIVGVREVERQATNCIQVDSPSHLYLAGRSLVPTHNSTWWFLILPMWGGAHQHVRFAAAFADSGSQAELHLATFKREQSDNELLRRDFPDFCEPMRRHNGRTVNDSQQMLYTRSHFAFAARGIDSTSLGMKVDEVRPDCLIFDDVEPPEATYSMFQREKRLSTVQNAILPLNELARVVVVGTVTMPGSIIHSLVRDAKGEETEDWIRDERFKTFHTRPILRRDDGTERSVWPDKWSLDYLNSIRQTRSFKLNYDNDPRGRIGEYWNEEDLRYGVPPNITHLYLMVDPPVTQRKTSDPCGLAIVGYAPGAVRQLPGHSDVLADHEAAPDQVARLSRAVILDAWDVQLTGKPLRAHILRTLHQWPRIGAVVLENNQGGDLWVEVMEGLPVKFLTFGSYESKEVRFGWALEFWQKRRVLIAKPIPKLEDQLTGFPRTQHDDVADAACCGVLRLLKPKPTKKNTTIRQR